MIRYTLSRYILGAAMLCLAFQVGADQAAKPQVPTLDEVLGASGISLSGHLDAAYSHASRTPTGHAFDTERNSFNLHQAAITVAKQPKEGFGVLVNITAGEDASVIDSNGLTSNSVDLTQAYAQFASGPITVIGGKFTTLAGAEVIASPGNAQYSRSLLFGVVPFTHTGLRANYALSEMLTLIGGINNGWDQVKDDNHQKTFELGALFTPQPGMSVALSDYLGTENTFLNTHGTRHLLDLVVNYAPEGGLSFGAEALYRTQKNFISLVNSQQITAKVQGVAFYVGAPMGENLKLSGRLEWLKDRDGSLFSIVDNKVKELTATLAYLAAKNTEIRVEGRYDKASKPTYADSLGAPGKSLTTYGVQFLYKF